MIDAYWTRPEPDDPAGPGMPGVTVVLCTCGRAGSVTRFLDSLGAQTRPPDWLLIVDASPDARTDAAAQRHVQEQEPPYRVRYWRVAGPYRGLTRQRNFALAHVITDLVAFFDDDVVLERGCLEAMEQAQREGDEAVAGVGCVSENEQTRPTRIWRLRRALGIVGTLRAGRYCRSGMAIPWAFVEPGDADQHGDWIPGYGMMWNTALARRIGFRDRFDGYAQSEDLDFSLRARRYGALVIARRARLRHLHAPEGRPDPHRLGFMEIYNRFHIHREAMAGRPWLDTCYFVYAWMLDTVLLLRRLRPPHAGDTCRQVSGRLRGGIAVLRGE